MFSGSDQKQKSFVPNILPTGLNRSSGKNISSLAPSNQPIWHQSIQPSCSYSLSCYLIVKKQRRIELHIGAANDQLDQLTDEMTKSKLIKSGLMHDLLTGHVRVKEPGDEA